MTIGERLMLLRESRGYSRRQVAEMIGCSQSALYSWEHDRCWISFEMAIALARLYGVTLDQLAGRKPLSTSCYRVDITNDL